MKIIRVILRLLQLILLVVICYFVYTTILGKLSIISLLIYSGNAFALVLFLELLIQKRLTHKY
jgi:hypothetical protein